MTEKQFKKIRVNDVLIPFDNRLKSMEEPVVLPAGQARVFRRLSRSMGGTETPVSLAASLRRRELLIGLFFFLLKLFVFFPEAFDAAGGIDQLLLSGKKRMAL